MLQAGWEALLRHAAAGTAWLLQWLPQSWWPDAAEALFSSVVQVRAPPCLGPQSIPTPTETSVPQHRQATGLGSLVLWNAPYAWLYFLRARAPPSAPSYFDRCVRR